MATSDMLFENGTPCLVHGRIATYIGFDGIGGSGKRYHVYKLVPSAVTGLAPESDFAPAPPPPPTKREIAEKWAKHYWETESIVPAQKTLSDVIEHALDEWEATR